MRDEWNHSERGKKSIEVGRCLEIIREKSDAWALLRSHNRDGNNLLA